MSLQTPPSLVHQYPKEEGPLSNSEENPRAAVGHPREAGMVAAVRSPNQNAKSKDKGSLGSRQRNDRSSTIWRMVLYPESQGACAGSQYLLLEGVLHYVEKDKTIRIIPPRCDRGQLFEEAAFGGHLRDSKIHGELSKRYWWPKMRSDIVRCVQSVLVRVRTGQFFPH